MSSMFDSMVYQRRNHTPWARISMHAFIDEMMWNAPTPGLNGEEKPHRVTISCDYRPEVSSRKWWSMKWICCDGSEREASSQYFDLMMWRAAQIELQAREQMDSEQEQLKISNEEPDIKKGLRRLWFQEWLQENGIYPYDWDRSGTRLATLIDNIYVIDGVKMSGGELCDEMRFVRNDPGVEVAIELVTSHGAQVINLGPPGGSADEQPGCGAVNPEG